MRYFGLAMFLAILLAAGPTVAEDLPSGQLSGCAGAYRLMEEISAPDHSRTLQMARTRASYMEFALAAILMQEGAEGEEEGDELRWEEAMDLAVKFPTMSHGNWAAVYSAGDPDGRILERLAQCDLVFDVIERGFITRK